MSGSDDIPGPIGLCASAPHRSVLGLLLVALDLPAYRGLEQDLKQTPPEHLAAITNDGHAQTILVSAFRNVPALASTIPRDLEIYLAEMQRANRDRNIQAVSQLREIVEILRPHKIPVLALKGAADVLNPIHRIPEHRYISDLDLLIPSEQSKQAARLIRKAKGLPTDAALLTAGAHHHLAQITHPDWVFTVELHVQPGSDTVSRILQTDEMFRTAQSTEIEGVFIPSIENRFLHHILHGMELRHQTAALNLRMLADHLRYLTILTKLDRKRALDRLRAVNLQDWQSDLTELAQILASQAMPAEQSWASKAIRNFGNPSAARLQDNSFWIRRYAQRFLTSATYRRQLLRKIFSPAAWGEFIAFHRDRRNKFR